MNNEELKNKIIDVLRDNIEYEVNTYPDDNYTELVIKYEALADALIAAGIGDTTNLIAENEVLQRDVDNLIRTLEEGTEEFQEVKYRADVEERALHCLARSFAEAMCKDGNTHYLIDGFIRDAYRQAKKELAEGEERNV